MKNEKNQEIKRLSDRRLLPHGFAMIQCILSGLAFGLAVRDVRENEILSAVLLLGGRTVPCTQI